MDVVTDKLRSLNVANDNELRVETEKALKQCGYEVMSLLGQKSTTPDEVSLSCKGGRARSNWVRQRSSRGGKSNRMIRRRVGRLKRAIERETSKMTVKTRDRIISKAQLETVSTPLYKYIGHNRMLVVLDEEKQGRLQATGGMTDRAWKAFDELLVELTGISVRDRKSTLKKMTEGSMPNFTVSEVEVIVKGKPMKRQMMLVDRITDVVCSRVVSLMEDDLLVPSSKITDLDDDTIMVRLAADKGGDFMATKIGLTVMNCVNANSFESFDLFGSLDAPDSYGNYKVLLSQYKEELEFYYDIVK